MKLIKGFTLIEFLISLILSALLLILSLEIYLSANHSYQLQNALNQVQESAKTAVTVLNKTIKETGTIGCLRLTDNFPILSYTPYSLTINNKLSGIGNNALEIRHASFPPAMLKKQDSLYLYIDTSMHFAIGDILIISDCRHAELLKIKNVSRLQGLLKITPELPLNYDYDQHAELSHLEIERFFVGKTEYKQADGSAIYALFKEDEIRKSKIAWAYHVNAIEFSYVVYRNGKQIELYSDQVSDWSKVLAISIKLELVYPPIKTNWQDYISVGEKTK